jgi:hypothetical protein
MAAAICVYRDIVILNMRLHCSEGLCMKAFTKNFWSVALAAMLLAGVLAFAQQGKGRDGKAATGSTSASGQNAFSASSEKAGTKSPLYEDKGSGTNPMSENRDTKATTVHTLDAASKDAAKMTSGTMGNVKNNPLYEQKSEGVNPLYERPDSNLKTADVSVPAPQSELAQENARYGKEGNKALKSPSIGAAGDHKNVVGYKDGEDGTTHSRPASHK